MAQCWKCGARFPGGLTNILTCPTCEQVEETKKLRRELSSSREQRDYDSDYHKKDERDDSDYDDENGGYSAEESYDTGYSAGYAAGRASRKPSMERPIPSPPIEQTGAWSERKIPKSKIMRFLRGYQYLQQIKQYRRQKKRCHELSSSYIKQNSCNSKESRCCENKQAEKT